MWFPLKQRQISVLCLGLNTGVCDRSSWMKKESGKSSACFGGRDRKGIKVLLNKKCTNLTKNFKCLNLGGKKYYQYTSIINIFLKNIMTCQIHRKRK